MSRLNFAPISDAFYLGSDQIKDTRSEIENLRKIIGDSELVKKPAQQNGVSKIDEGKKRIGYGDKIVANFDENNKSTDENLDILKLVQHPRFNDIVKNYILLNKPEWIKNPELTSTSFLPNNQKENFVKSNLEPPTQQNFIYFLIFGLLVYIFLEKTLKS